MRKDLEGTDKKAFPLTQYNIRNRSTIRRTETHCKSIKSLFTNRIHFPCVIQGTPLLA